MQMYGAIHHVIERDKRQLRMNLPVSPGGISEWVPPDPISNSEVKLLCADDSVVFRHAKVGHCQALIPKPLWSMTSGVSFFH